MSNYVYVNDKRVSVEAFLTMDMATIITLDARGCTALTEIKADNAEYLDASGCTALMEIKADNAKTLDASGCTALTEIKADNAAHRSNIMREAKGDLIKIGLDEHVAKMVVKAIIAGSIAHVSIKF